MQLLINNIISGGALVCSKSKFTVTVTVTVQEAAQSRYLYHDLLRRGDFITVRSLLVRVASWRIVSGSPPIFTSASVCACSFPRGNSSGKLSAEGVVDFQAARGRRDRGKNPHIAF